MSFTYTDTIPAANNDPSDDQPKMLVNTASIKQIINVDHQTFGDGNDGWHKQIHFADNNAIGDPGVDNQSGLYTAQGTASTVSDLRFINNNEVFPVSCVRACGVFTIPAAAGNIVPDNQFNVVGNVVYAQGALYTYDVTLEANAVTGNNVIVLAFASSATLTALTYTFSNPTLQLLSAANATTGDKISFVVLQI